MTAVLDVLCRALVESPHAWDALTAHAIARTSPGSVERDAAAALRWAVLRAGLVEGAAELLREWGDPGARVAARHLDAAIEARPHDPQDVRTCGECARPVFVGDLWWCRRCGTLTCADCHFGTCDRAGHPGVPARRDEGQWRRSLDRAIRGLRVPLGFSTGALSPGSIRGGMGRMDSAVELSALRESELPELVEVAETLDRSLYTYRHVSAHAPGRLVDMAEAALVRALHRVAARGIPMVAHPCVIRTPFLWRRLGSMLLVENMDLRKPGRTVGELAPLFAWLPEAGMCLDVGHAHAVDPTMGVARDLVAAFGDRIREVHVSMVDPDGRHHILPREVALRMSGVLAGLDVPAIIEAPVGPATTHEAVAATVMALTAGMR